LNMFLTGSHWAFHGHRNTCFYEAHWDFCCCKNKSMYLNNGTFANVEHVQGCEILGIFWRQETAYTVCFCTRHIGTLLLQEHVCVLALDCYPAKRTRLFMDTLSGTFLL
jgi:aminopeptidase-like protein